MEPLIAWIGCSNNRIPYLSKYSCSRNDFVRERILRQRNLDVLHWCDWALHTIQELSIPLWDRMVAIVIVCGLIRAFDAIVNIKQAQRNLVIYVADADVLDYTRVPRL